MNFDILEVFTRAGKILWKFKVLWIFGMFASCGRSSGSSGNSNTGNNGANQPSDNPFSPEMTRQLEGFVQNFTKWFEQNPWIIFAFIAFVLILIILQVFITNIGIAGLARGVVHAENGAETLRFGELFSESLKYFWRLFWSSVLIALPFIIFLIAFFAILIFSAGSLKDPSSVVTIMIILLIPFCCCLLLLSIFIGLYSTQVVRAITIEDMGVFAAFGRGWQIFTKNILGLILAGIILGIGSAMISILVSLPTIIIVLPLVFSFMDGNITSWQPFILTGIFLLCYSPIAWFFMGILVTYTESVWSLIYLRITKNKEENNNPILAEANA